jgi:F-type H+-transporting ATPase subunit epsilon
MASDKVEFELVSPERLLLSEQVDMVVVPGAEGDFGVLPRHAPLISTLRPGVIRVFEGREVKERIFVAGGFAEVTPERCTVLAEEAVPVSEIDAGKLDQELKNLGEDLADAKTDEEKAAIAKRIAVRKAMQAASA